MRLPLGQSAALGRRFIDLTPEITGAIALTIEAGWALALQRSEVTTNADEVTMTECLRDAMREALRIHRFPWGRTMIIAPGTESRSQFGMITPDGRTDIPLYLVRVFARSGEHDPHAIIECKRVAQGDTRLAREYVAEGINRFGAGKYSENHARGFMIGYVLSGSPAAVVSEINAHLMRQGRGPEALAETSVSARWTSSHPRPSPSVPIILHHTMLPVQ